MKASKEAEEIEIAEKCASVCQNLNNEKNHKIQQKQKFSIFYYFY